MTPSSVRVQFDAAPLAGSRAVESSRPTSAMASEGRGGGGGDRLMEAFIVSAATEVGDKMTPIMMFCYAPVDAHLMQYKPVPGMSQPWHTAAPPSPS